MGRRLGIHDLVRFGAQPTLFAISNSCLVLTSETEGLPLVLLEAQSAGVPVVTTAAGGAVEAMVDGETGFVVPIGDAEAAAERTLRLLQDPELRRRMGSAGLLYVQRHLDAPRIAERFLAICRGEAARPS